MLHTAKLPSASVQSAADDLSASATFMAARATVERQWPTMLYVVLLVIALGAIYLFTAQLPTYMKLVQYVDCREGSPELVVSACHRIVAG